MTKRPLPEQFVLLACTGKEAFATRSDAERAARRINRSGMKRRPVVAYACQVCGHAHIGGKKKPGSEKLPMI